MERPAPAHLPQLDALRGVAILAVFVQHLGDRFLPLVRSAIERHAPEGLAPWILTVIHHAWWGVDLFFVLSGFSLALSWIRSGGQTTRSFFLRRAARILPGYWVALAITLLFHRAVVFQEGFVPAMLAHSLVLQGYLAPGGIILIGAAWSLTTEVCFYLLFPLLARLLLAPKSQRVFIGCSIILVSWLSRAALHELFLEPGVWSGAFEMTQRRLITSRLDQFVLGMLAARLFVSLERSSRATKLAPISLSLSLPLLVCAFKLEGTYFLEPLGTLPYALLSIITTQIVLSASLCRGRALSIVAPRPLVFVGVSSYGVFLYHQLFLGLSDLDRLSPPSWMNLARTTLLALASSLSVGYVSWVLVERPAMRRANRTTKMALQR